MLRKSVVLRACFGGLLGATVAAVAACGSAEQTTPTQPPAAQPPAATATTPPAAQQPTATPTQATGGEQVTPTGTLRAATHDIRFPVGIPRFSQAQSYHQVAGIVETPFGIARSQGGDYITEPRLALSYEVSPDLKYADVTIRRGVQFHDGYGEMTAEDVAWSFNDANARTNPESVHDTAGDLAAMFLNTEVVDADTVRFNFNVYASNWAARILSDFWEGPAVYSKRVFDELGPEGMRDRMVGTGPFRVIEYTQNNRLHMGAFMDHWNRPPYVSEAIILEVPEDAARRAMLETGEVSIANLPVKDWPDLLNRGFQRAPEGYFSEIAISFGGNWWDSTNIITGEPLERTLDLSKPWISPARDADPARWEQAKNFRLALAHSIDREALNQGLLSGLGRVGYTPGWPVETQGFKDEWRYELDYDLARNYLSQSTAPNGATIDFWVGPSGLNPELGEAIAGIWEAELGVRANFDKTQYNASFRPSIIQRSVNKMWFCGTDGVNVPVLWPKGFLLSTVSAGGFMCGTEHRPFGEIYIEMSRESDPEKLRELSLEFYDELRETVVQVGVVDSPAFPLYNANTIAEWQMRPEGKGSLAGFNSLWNVKLK